MAKPKKPKPYPKPRLLLWALALIVPIFLGGCVMPGLFKPMEPIAVPENLSETAKEAQKVINEANIALTAAYVLVWDKRDAGLISKAEALKNLDTLDGYGSKVDEAETLLSLGDGIGATNKAELVRDLIDILRRHVSEKARQP